MAHKKVIFLGDPDLLSQSLKPNRSSDDDDLAILTRLTSFVLIDKKNLTFQLI